MDSFLDEKSHWNLLLYLIRNNYLIEKDKFKKYSDIEEAFEAVKSSEEPYKIFYTLLYIGLVNKMLYNVVEGIIERSYR